MVGTEGDSLPADDHQQIEREPRRSAQHALGEAEFLTPPGFGEDPGDGYRHRDAPDQEAGDAQHGPARPQARGAAERTAHQVTGRVGQPDLADPDGAGAGALGEVLDVAEAQDHQRDHRGEQLDGHQDPQGGAVDVAEPAQHGRCRPQLLRPGQSPVALFESGADLALCVAGGHRTTCTDTPARSHIYLGMSLAHPLVGRVVDRLE